MSRIITLSLLITVGAQVAAAEGVFPGETWQRKTPAQVGLEESKLDGFAKLAGGRGCVVRYGSLVYAWSGHTRRGDVASAAKPVYAHFLFKAVEDGRIASLDEKVGKYQPRLAKLNADLGNPDANITWRHLANQTSCYGVTENPGTAFDYSDWQMALFWDLLFTKVYGSDYESVDDKVLRPLLADGLQCQDKPTLMAFGVKDRPGRLAISPRDFARFGLLYLNQGTWNGKELLSEKHATMAVSSPLPLSIPRTEGKKAAMLPGQRSIGGGNNQTDHNGGYSWLWWLNGVSRDGRRWWADAPADVFLCLGHGGREGLAVFPGLEMIVSWNGAQRIHSDRKLGNRAFKVLAEAAEDAAATERTATSLREGPHPRPLSPRERGEEPPLPRGEDGEAQRSPVRGLGAPSSAKAANPSRRARTPANRGAGKQGDVSKQRSESFAKWSRIELVFSGPRHEGAGEPNPFAVRLDVSFVSPSGHEYSVPGFYDGDGRGGLDGNVWKVRFSADETGTWQYAAKSSEESLDGHDGSFRVTAVPVSARGFWQAGRLEAVGTPENGIRYLKFRDGSYWLKAGCDDPENFLGRFENYDTREERLAAIDFLAERGVNSLYIMLHTLGGDHRDVWPWLGESEREARGNAGENARFDVARLEEWRELFEHMQTKGVVPYLVLEDDSAFKDYDHRRCYREVVARFGYLPALLFNLGEEANENYKLEEALVHLELLARIDSFNHPRGIHNVNRPHNAYVDAPHVDFTAIQTGAPGRARSLEFALQHNQIAIDWMRRCRERGRRVLMIGFDEGRPEEDRRAWWSAYLGGGVWEAHVREPYDRPYSAWEPVWTELGGARAFLETLPFWKMEPHNDAVVDGRGFCLAQPGKAYAVYLPEGGAVRVELSPGARYEAEWWDPQQGQDGAFQHRIIVRGGLRDFKSPGSGDWALRIRRTDRDRPRR